MSSPTVTIIVVPREQFSRTQPSLETLHENTSYPFSLIYIDGGSPVPVRDYLQAKAKEKGFTVIRTEEFVTPNEARNIALPYANSEFLVFLDNDVHVSQGWLQSLLQCAEETQASAVGPLYCEGRFERPLIHNAGGDVQIQEVGGIEISMRRGVTKGSRSPKSLIGSKESRATLWNSTACWCAQTYFRKSCRWTMRLPEPASTSIFA